MTDAKRRNKILVNGTEEAALLLMGSAAGIGLWLANLTPTGNGTTDAIVLVLCASLVTWAGATAPWWALTAAAAVSTALAEPWLGTLLGAASLALTLAIGSAQRSQKLVRGLSVCALLFVLSTAGEVYRFGASGVIASVIALAVGVAGITRRRSRDRKRAYVVLGSAVGVLVIGVVGLAVSGANARDSLTDGNDSARQGLAFLKGGDFAAAQVEFERASSSFYAAADSINSPVGQISRFVPIASQYRNAGVELAASAAEVSGTIADTLRDIDLNALRISDGAIELQAVEALAEPLGKLQDSMADLDVAIENADSPWLVGRVRTAFAEFRDEIADQQVLGEKAMAAVEMAPEFLGSEEARVYFVMFTTPAEARGQGGFMGNYAELTIDSGAISITDFGRTADLANAMDHPVVLERAPSDWLQRFGSSGFDRGNDGIAHTSWSVINMSAHFPNTAAVVDELYEKSGGQPIDGVLSLDVYAVQALVGLVGPIDVANGPTLTSDNTAQFLLFDQYLDLPDADHADINSTRVDLLETVALDVTGRLLSSDSPDPLEFGRALAPLAGEGRVLVWSEHPAEQALLESVNLDGRVLDVDVLANSNGVTRQGVQVVVNNAGANKIDSFLSVSTSYDEQSGTFSSTFSNAAPSSGLPRYIIGNSLERQVDWGTNILLATVYTTDPIRVLSLDGEPVPSAAALEAGRHTYEFRLEVPAGSSRTVEFSLAVPTNDPVVVDAPLVKR